MVDVEGVLDLDPVMKLELPGELGHALADGENPRVLEEGEEEACWFVTVVREAVDEGLGADVEAEDVVRHVLIAPVPPRVVRLSRDADENGGFGEGGLERLLEPFGGD